MFQRVRRAATLRNQLIIGFQLALFWATAVSVRYFGKADCQSRTMVKGGGGLTGTSRRETGCHPQPRPIPESPPALGTIARNDRPKSSVRIHLDCHDRPVGYQVEELAFVASPSGREPAPLGGG
jgi:hypothetical protein